MDSLILDTVIGVVFVFGIFAFAVSSVVEVITRFLGLRAEFLLRGVSSLLDPETKFGWKWLTGVVGEADIRQAAADQRAITEAVQKLETLKAKHHSEMSGATTALDGALTRIEALVAARQAHAAAANVAGQDARDEAARQAAEAALKQTSADYAAAKTVASEALQLVPSALAAAEIAVGALPGSDRATATDQLVTARALHLLAERALAAASRAPMPAVSVAAVVRQPIVDLTAALEVPATLGTGRRGRVTYRQKRRMPSYLSSRSFAQALVHTLVPPNGSTTTFDQLRASVASVSDNELRAVLTAHLDVADGTVRGFRGEVEKWYDDHMARVSGWYKRHTRWHLLAVGALFAVLFNVNAVAMARAFYADEALRESVVTAAVASADCRPAGTEPTPPDTPSPRSTPTPGTKTPSECLQQIRKDIDELREAGLPIGWGAVPDCRSSERCTRWDQKLGILPPDSVQGSPQESTLTHVALLVGGWLIIALSSMVGARFWFDLLSRLGTLRSTGPKPDRTA